VAYPAYLGLEVVLVSDSSTKLDDSLETLDLSLDDSVKVLFPDGREWQKVHGSRVERSVRRGWRGGKESLVDGF